MTKFRLFRSTLIVSCLTMISRILGLVRDMVLMSVFGATGLMDAFLVAFKIPNFLRRLFADGAFSQAFVPILTEYKETKQKTDIKLLISRFAGTFSILLIILTTLVIILSPLLINIFAVGFDQQQSILASELLQITFPYLFFIAITGFFSSILQSYEKFFLPAFVPILLNIAMIIGALCIAPLLDMSIKTLAYAVVVAGLIQMLIQLPNLYRLGFLVKPQIDFSDNGVKRIFRLMLPAIFAVSITQINVLINTIFASMMITGSVSWLYTAERLSELPLGFIGIAIGAVILPNLTKYQTKTDDKNFQQTLDWATRLVLLVGVPASVALFLLADTIMITLFQQGNFSYHDAMMSGFALECMSGGILGFMLIKIFTPAFFARQDDKTPVKIGAISILSNIVLSLVFIGIFYWQNLALHGALALATTGASFVNVGLLYYQLHQQHIWKIDKSWFTFILQLSIATFIMVLALWVILPYFPNYADFWQQLIILIGLCLVGMMIYSMALLMVGVRFTQFILKHS